MMNYHFHDELSSDAHAPLSEHCVAAAGEVTHVCVTNHAEVMDETGGWRADPAEMIPRFLRGAGDVKSAREAHPDLEIRLGVELEYRPEWREGFEELVAAVPFDFVLGSVHIVDGMNISGGPGVDRFFEGRTQSEAYSAYFRELAEMVEWGGFDVVAHFDLVKRYGHRHYGPYDPADFRDLILPVLGAMAARGIGLEINTSGVDQAPGAPYPEPQILEWARDAGVRVLTIGSDSHRPDRFAAGLAEGRRLARRAGWESFTVFEGRSPAGRIEVGP